ncbi:MAG: cbb3-type cytochrome c oxidase subunit 3 [Sinimarinibacterium sp.]|jgi:cytochrome c oxidase cbb3-type subunit 4
MSSGVITAVLLVAFLVITAWAYSKRNRERFRDAAQLPLNDEPVATKAAARSDAHE